MTHEEAKAVRAEIDRAWRQARVALQLQCPHTEQIEQREPTQGRYKMRCFVCKQWEP